MKYFFIHKTRPIGSKYVYNDQLAFATKEEDLNKLINSNVVKDYLKIPSFKEGDKIKIDEKAPKMICGKEFVFEKIDDDGTVHVTEEVNFNLYITDIKDI